MEKMLNGKITMKKIMTFARNVYLLLRVPNYFIFMKIILSAVPNKLLETASNLEKTNKHTKSHIIIHLNETKARQQHRLSINEIVVKLLNGHSTWYGTCSIQLNLCFNI